MARNESLISDQLRAALLADRRSLYAIAQASAVPRSCLAAFCRGDRSVTVDTVDRLAAVLGLRLIRLARRRTGR